MSWWSRFLAFLDRFDPSPPTLPLPPMRPIPIPPPPPPAEVETVEAMVAEVNWVRIHKKRTSLVADHAALQAAWFQSLTQSELDGGHTHENPSPGMEAVWDRLEHYGAILKQDGDIHSGEVVAQAPSIKEAVKGWLNSPEHREIMLRPNWRWIGVSRSRARSGRIYYTGVFYR